MRGRLSKEGDERIKTRFAFIPVVVGLEWRWLTKVTTKQKYMWVGYKEPFLCWEDIEFIDE